MKTVTLVSYLCPCCGFPHSYTEEDLQNNRLAPMSIAEFAAMLVEHEIPHLVTELTDDLNMDIVSLAIYRPGGQA